VASDALFEAFNERAANASEETDPIFPLIQGILTFDTPYNGLARSMFVYGAFSNYSKVNGVFNAMTALSAAAPATLSRLGARNAATSVPAPSGSGSSRNPAAWAGWQLAAVRTGTVGAIAAGGVAAYVHRESIMKGVQSLRNMNRESIAQGYNQSMNTLGQGLAYINRGNVGQSFAWLSDHFTFVGALMKQAELKRRLDRLAAIKGVGVHDFYCSLGENGYWSGGYFVPERTFCAVPTAEDNEKAHALFERCVMREAEDEIKAHLQLFKPEKHKGYEEMTEKSADLVKKWFLSEEQAVDEPKFREGDKEEKEQDDAANEFVKRAESEEPGQVEEAAKDEKNKDIPDESPLDIAAAAALVPLPGGEGDMVANADPNSDAQEEQKRTYLQYLFGIAQNTGSEVKGWWPEKVPNVSSMAKMPSSLPKMPNVSSAVSSLGQVSMPNFLGKKGQEKEKDTSEAEARQNETGTGEKPAEEKGDAAEGEKKTEGDSAESKKVEA
jgi:hypothetical protein